MDVVQTFFKFKLFKSVRRSPLWMTGSADTQFWHTIAFSSPTLLQTPTRRVNKPDEAETSIHGQKKALCVSQWNLIKVMQERTRNNLVLKNSTSKKNRNVKDPNLDLRILCLPDYLYQLTHVNMVGDEELGLVQDRKLLFSLIPLNDHLEEKILTIQTDTVSWHCLEIGLEQCF